MRYLIYILLALSLSSFTEENLQDISDILKEVETNGRVDAIGDNGKAYGILQIHKICVDDVNRVYGTSYTHEDMFQENCSEEVFILYINIGIRLYQKRNGKDPSEEDIVRFWNGGYSKGHLRKSTLEYYRKYKKYKTRLC